MKQVIKFGIIVILLFGLIGCGGGAGGGVSDNYAGGPSGTGVGTRAEVTGTATDAEGVALGNIFVGDLVGQGSTVTDKNGTYRLFAEKNREFQVELYIRDDASNIEDTLRIQTAANDDSVQADFTRRADGSGFDAEVVTFNSGENLGGGFTAPGVGGSASSDNSSGSTTEDFLTEGNEPDFQTNESQGPGLTPEEQIQIESFDPNQ